MSRSNFHITLDMGMLDENMSCPERDEMRPCAHVKSTIRLAYGDPKNPKSMLDDKTSE